MSQGYTWNVNPRQATFYLTGTPFGQIKREVYFFIINFRAVLKAEYIFYFNELTVDVATGFVISGDLNRICPAVYRKPGSFFPAYQKGYVSVTDGTGVYKNHISFS